jgi:hypothetical protein
VTRPTYLLSDVQARVRLLGRRAFTSTAIATGQHELGMTVSEMIDFICARTDRACFKTMQARGVPDAMQDVYRWPCPNGRQTAYVKVSLHPASRVVISFKER